MTTVTLLYADESPEGCNQAAVVVSIVPTADGTAFPVDSWALPGQEITYVVLLAVPPNDPSQPDMTCCDVAGGQLGVTLPDWSQLPLREGQFVPLAGYPGCSLPTIPPFGNVDGAGGLPPLEVPYLAQVEHADAAGLLHARVDYGQTWFIDLLEIDQDDGLVQGQIPMPVACGSVSAVWMAWPAVSLSAQVYPEYVCRDEAPTEVTYIYTVSNFSTAAGGLMPPDLTAVELTHGIGAAIDGPFGDDGDGHLNAGESWFYTSRRMLTAGETTDVDATALAVDGFGQAVTGVVYADGDTATATTYPDVNGDGFIGVDDLLGVVLAWGAGEGPAEVTGDGTVDADDLLAVIMAWGDSGC